MGVLGRGDSGTMKTDFLWRLVADTSAKSEISSTLAGVNKQADKSGKSVDRMQYS